MYKHLTSACALMALLTLLSCSKTSDPTKPDDTGNNNNNNNNSHVKGIIYLTTNAETDTNRVVWATDDKGNNKREIMRGRIRFNSVVKNEKTFIVKEGYNPDTRLNYSSLYLVDLKTGSSELIERSYDRSHSFIRIRREAAITNDGNKVCFVVDSVSSYPQNGLLHQKSRLYVLDLRTREKIQLADDVAEDQQLRISNDDKYITYYGGWYDNTRPTDILYVASLDGTLKKRIISDGRYVYFAASTLEWSNNNKFLMTTTGENTLIFINTLSWQVEKTIVIKEFERILFPVFSADDNKVYFSGTKNYSSHPDFSCELYSYSIQGEKLSQITDSAIVGYKFGPRISKDGSNLLFSSSTIFDEFARFYFFRTLHTMNLKDSSITTLPDKSTYMYNWVE